MTLARRPIGWREAREPLPKRPRPEIGIGRTVDLGWSEAFWSSFAAVAPSGMRVIPRVTPGIMYMSPANLQRMRGGLFENREAAHNAVEEFAHQQVSRLVELSELDVGAQQSHNFQLDQRLRADRRQKKVLRICALVIDAPSQQYSGGFQLAGEKAVVQSALGVSRDRISAEIPPLHRLVMGTIGLNESQYVDLNEIFSEVSQNIDGNPVLGRIGAVSVRGSAATYPQV